MHTQKSQKKQRKKKHKNCYPDDIYIYNIFVGVFPTLIALNKQKKRGVFVIVKIHYEWEF